MSILMTKLEHHHDDAVEHVVEDLKAIKELNEVAPSSLSVPIAIIVAGIIVALAIISSGGRSGVGGGEASVTGGIVEQKPVVGAGGIPAVEVNAEDLFTDNDAFLGNPAAKIVIVEFGDFQCPFCGKFFKETEPQIIDKYVKTGKVRFIYKQFAFLGQESNWAAEASECAKDQGKFWQYHDYLYNHLWDNYYAKNQNGENVGAFSKDNLKKFAGTLGLNAGEFSQCLDSGKYTKKVQADIEVGRKNGVSGTPTSFVNGKLLVGAQPLEAFDQAIAEALK
ncbi:MAG: hypothetical protein A3G49_04140 [Candidatus Sungbacteria bacterium RIFCSPLOWO2_12_FULL_41_11]|uniref:Thioredoxin domain-containing protein n=1 Tax=Candidatus Sungbacteria bacterium RIFCSPLOWO2_12_FULL_41_11 TaxID=1802286 RepID=A0A1G2LVN1_9BACT|nr:MAG: DsbA oxidoreductase [Parcubacteria group bacterium GW2011_GWA2_42_14]OGZ99325.1 MAG: hypothetical protein A3D41_02605 [Candidatus Sungbacteria bacterium RIFCSPHIGHO2_02_FULL_41_12b]OHA14851.1 MAG: hypothetical protein A3G49_04140 [Candidatus Sungbacteria bacterium RIFCSPLOWO2_12_FULL_41_11]